MVVKMVTRSVKVTKKGTVSLVLSCRGDAALRCRGRVALNDSKGSPYGSAPFSILSGARGVVVIKLHSKGFKALVKKKRLAIDVTVTAPDSLGGINVDTKTLTLLAPPPTASRSAARRR
jgi:hypothetical protein